jgi:hypothetical protein
MIKPNGNRCVLQLTKKYITDKGKPVLDEDGQPRYIIEQPAKVLSSNIPEIKKGMTVYPIIRGGVPIYHLEDKKKQVVVIDNEDIYATEI